MNDTALTNTGVFDKSPGAMGREGTDPNKSAWSVLAHLSALAVGVVLIAPLPSMAQTLPSMLATAPMTIAGWALLALTIPGIFRGDARPAIVGLANLSILAGIMLFGEVLLEHGEVLGGAYLVVATIVTIVLGALHLEGYLRRSSL